ncbi:MAG: hypothetical protein KatS3mg124_1844 [Porticoccaceae bacterium]|nr:MAG: hypothetical protein KatS3mg124_1844 [Porticoccaceae bacterium]
MSAIQVLEAVAERISARVGPLTVVQVHTQDLSDAHTGKWLVRLPAVYLVCEGIDARRPDDAALHLRAYVLARLADQRASRALEAWALAEAVLAAISDDPHITRARMDYRDEAGLDQPGIALWEIAAMRRHVLTVATADPWTPETILASWAPWIGAAHESRYRPLDGDAPDPGVTIGDLAP